MVSGTDRIIPVGPSIHPQKLIESKITIADNPSPLLIIFGSIKFPITISINTKKPLTHKHVAKLVVINAKIIGGIAAIIEPMIGMKFKKNAKTAHSMAYLILKAINKTKIHKPVMMLVCTLIIK